MAAAKKTLSERQFQSLVSKFKTLQKQAKSLTADASLKTYWSYGNLIAQLHSEADLGYHNSLLQDLARETNISLRTLQQSYAFRKAYKTPPAADSLSWSHFRVLIRLPSEKQRTFYARLAKKESWSSRELQNAIASNLYEGGQLIDPVLERPTDVEFLYRAELVHVVDGDTLDVLVDLGFRTFAKQRLRLARIDAEETTSAQGRAARNFLTETIGAAATIVLQTRKTDLHGRYVAHVFVSPQKVSIDECFKSGLYVNDLLVREKHAHVVG